MFCLGRWDQGRSDSVNTSQSQGPLRWNGIAHPESEKVKFIFSIFFPLLSLAHSPIYKMYQDHQEWPLFFHNDVQFTFVNKKKNSAWGHPPRLLFFLNRKRFSDVYMLKSKAANLPTHLTGIDNCQSFSLYITGFWAELGNYLISIYLSRYISIYFNQQNNCYYALAHFLGYHQPKLPWKE